MQDTNPLLAIGQTIAFDQIRPEHVEPAVALAMSKATEALEAVASAPPSREHTLLAFDRALVELSEVVTVVRHLESVVTSPELREVYNRIDPEVSAFYAAIYRDARLLNALLAFRATPEAAGLTPAETRFLTESIEAFQREGAGLSAETQHRLGEISRKLAELSSRFSQNLVDETAAFSLLVTCREALDGLPDSALKAAEEDAKSQGEVGYRFTLQAPSLIPALTYLKSASLREQLYTAYHSRASSGARNNGPLIEAMLKLRQEKAEILGYRDFSDLVLADRMAKNGAKAFEFVERLKARSVASFETETEELQAFQREHEGVASQLKPWDVGYEAERLRQKRYDFDEEALRPYFPLPSVLHGLFSLVNRLYGVEVKPITLPSWHAEVQSYALCEGDRQLGQFYMDLFPRDEKRGGAWMDAFITGMPGSKALQHVGLICANLTRPLGDQPALLNHREVETLFHEFGHLLHHLLAEPELYSQAGTQVAWDFVELPSQIMENWCWEREALALFARHVETGETIPEELLAKMEAARNFRSASAMMRQLGFASVDLWLHRDFKPGSEPLLPAVMAHMQPFSPAQLVEGYAFITGFGHLFSSAVGYAAGYYSYKWAEVLDADAFTRFQSEGIFSREVGEAFRRQILARGDSQDPSELFSAFMGRDPDPEALFRRAGL